MYVLVFVCILFLPVISLYIHTNMEGDNKKSYFSSELYHVVTFVVRVMLLFSQCKSVFTNLPRTGFVKGFVCYRSSINMRGLHSFLPSFLPFPPPSFLFSLPVLPLLLHSSLLPPSLLPFPLPFCITVYAIVGNFIKCAFLAHQNLI